MTLELSVVREHRGICLVSWARSTVWDDFRVHEVKLLQRREEGAALGTALVLADRRPRGMEPQHSPGSYDGMVGGVYVCAERETTSHSSWQRAFGAMIQS